MKSSRVKNLLYVSFIPLAFAPIFLGCSGTSSSDQVYNAQSCLDKTTQANALNCYSMVSGNTTTAAYLIRCASVLYYEGVSNPTALQSVISHLTGSGSSTTVAAGALAFTANAGTGNPSNSTDVTQAADAVVQCAASNSTGLTTLATLASVATAASNVVGLAGSGFSATTISSLSGAQITTLVNSIPALPSLVTTSYAQNCSGTISSSNQSFCTQYATALTASGGNASAATTYYLQHLN